MTPHRRTFSTPVVPLTQQEPGQHGPYQALCDHATPQTHKRRSSSLSPLHQRRDRFSSPSWLGAWTFFSFALLTLLSICSNCPGATASNLHARNPGHMDLHDELLFDRSPRPVSPMALKARQDDSISDQTMTTTTTTSSLGTSTTTTASSLNLAAPTTTNSLPRPFDTSLGNNFTTTSCPQFFQTFLKDDAFNDCLPLSLLLQTSNGFFQASQSLVSMTQTLDATCHVDYAQCSALMSSLATQIQATSNCGADFELQNPVVLQAYHGFIAYGPLYDAGCLTDSSSSQGNYCFANAITNASAPTSSYIYYLPLGVQLPAGTRPTCNSCLQNTMSIFAAAASNRTQPLAGDYMAAAQQIDMGCGPTFVETSVTPSSAADSLPIPPIAGTFTILFMVMMLYLS